MRLLRSETYTSGLLIAAVMACGFLTFYSLPDGIPFLVRLTMMAATQVAVGKALQREGRRDERWTITTEPRRQPRRSNDPTAAVQCPTCGAEPGWRCMVSTGGAMRRNFHKARVRNAAGARARDA